MIPNFPLEDERDDLTDWIYCLDTANIKETAEEQCPSMDVLLLIKRQEKVTKATIVGGIAFEYYRQAQCGLMSYLIVGNEFRRHGILRSLHPVACEAIQLLHHEQHNCNTSAKAIFAETNTVEASECTEMIRKRHEILYRLGYRQLAFPYSQPPLSENSKSFEIGRAHV